ncbi:uncharacterized protein Mppe isoform X3 [Diachasmimorpha longicaudata]|uniref:uncharacterized protein Mppe isoform X3 n=1 Tax=Diachasmimorpha longicaudata TaxID=58733 RepID=UPI0030B8A583
MIRRNRTKYKLFMIAFILGSTILYCEFLAYEIQRFKWSGRECNECVKVLLVADPQILGEKNENYFGAWFARWDNDRYLAKTFTRAMSHAQPDVIVFLGDLMDEGHISTMQDFSRYKSRFDRIFQTPEHILTIYLPGDNDIGGEEDSVSAAIHNRFKFAFSQPDYLTHKSLSFYKVIKELSPQVIFTAHEHKAMHLSLDTTIDELSDIWVLPPHETSLYQLRLDMGDIHELQIPTCSYRMGTVNMGYGLAYIDTHEKSVDFTILWLPERFPKLKGYLWVFSIVMTFILSSFICNCCAWSTHVAYSHLPAV